MNERRPPRTIDTNTAPATDKPGTKCAECVESRELLSPEGQCWICHAGQRYRLRVTAANKLILTK